MRIPSSSTAFAAILSLQQGWEVAASPCPPLLVRRQVLSTLSTMHGAQEATEKSLSGTQQPLHSSSPATVLAVWAGGRTWVAAGGLWCQASGTLLSWRVNASKDGNTSGLS